MGRTPFYGARAEKPPKKADFAMKQTNICRLSGDIIIVTGKHSFKCRLQQIILKHRRQGVINKLVHTVISSSFFTVYPILQVPCTTIKFVLHIILFRACNTTYTTHTYMKHALTVLHVHKTTISSGRSRHAKSKHTNTLN